MKTHQPSSTENTCQVGQEQLGGHQSKPASGTLVPNLETTSQVVATEKGERQKKITRKAESMLRKLTVECPLSFSHVHNFLNILGFNQKAIRNPKHEESFFRSIFYIKNVEKVELRKNAVILFLRNSQTPPLPIEYLVNRYNSFGDASFHRLATEAERVAKQFAESGFLQKIGGCFEGEPLSRFIESMQGEIYMCKVAPNKLVISRQLLELIGEDMQDYALQLCKYKTPFREIISSETYSPIITESVRFLGLLCDYLQHRISLEQLTALATVDFSDYILTRKQKKIFCKLTFYMPTPLISCLKVREVVSVSDAVGWAARSDLRKHRLVERECQQKRYEEAETLKNLIRMPDSMLVSNRQRLAGYYLREEVQHPAD